MDRPFGYDGPMIETAFFFAGFGFSVLVYHRSIRPRHISLAKKTLYTIFTFIGITGMVFLFGVMASHVLSGWNAPR